MKEFDSKAFKDVMIGFLVFCLVLIVGGIFRGCCVVGLPAILSM